MADKAIQFHLKARLSNLKLLSDIDLLCLYHPWDRVTRTVL